MNQTVTTEPAAPVPANVLAGIGKAMHDLDDLVRLLGKSTSRAKPWQRQLAGHLSELDRLLQVLRMTVVIERSDAEIVAAADALLAACRKCAAAIAGSRCDLNTQAAVRVLVGLASGVRHALRQ